MTKEKYDIVKKEIERGDSFHKKRYPYFHEFINFLHTENILYYLCSGTLLGCIRHKGRVPWDDDYDIYMNTSEIKRLEKYSQNTSNIERFDLSIPIICYFKLKKYSYVMTEQSGGCGFYHIWQYKEDIGKIGFKVTDIFNQSDAWYRRTNNFFVPNPLKYPFHDLMCNVSKNFDKELRFFYENYMNEYVVSNHTMSSCYRKVDKYKRIILTKEEFDKIMKELNSKSGAAEIFSWKQTPEDVEVSVPLPSGTRGKQCKVKFGNRSLKIDVNVENGVKLNFKKLYGKIHANECEWTISDGILVVTMEKGKTKEVWPTLDS